MMVNPLLTVSSLPFGAPAFNEVRREHYMPAFREAIAAERAEVDAIVACPEVPDFSNTIEALERSGNALDKVCSIFFNLLEAENALEPGSLKERYPEFASYEGKCRFRECLHDREPGCAVTQAAEQGKISRERLERYRELLAEAREAWRDRYD